MLRAHVRNMLEKCDSKIKKEEEEKRMKRNSNTSQLIRCSTDTHWNEANAIKISAPIGGVDRNVTKAIF